MKTEIVFAKEPQALELAEEFIHQGKMVAFPTDTVYGLGVSAFNPQGIDQLYEVKERENRKAIAVLLSSPAELAKVTSAMSDLALRLAERLWPGPLTLVVPRHPDLPDNLSPLPTIGVRMPDHPLALALIARTGPLAVTSANLSGGENTSTAQEVFAQLSGRIPLILDGGRTPGGLPSTVVDCTKEDLVILRQGPISKDELRKVLSNYS